MTPPGKPDPSQHGIVEDERGQDQPADKSRAQDATHGEIRKQETPPAAPRRRPARRANMNERGHRKKDER